MIHVQPYGDHAAFRVLSRLDPADWAEACAIRGQPVSHLQLFAEWRAMSAGSVASWCLHATRTGQPFALVALSNTGQAGVAQAAALACDHAAHRAELLATVRLIRRRMPGFCADLGIHRIEARAWARHPRAMAFLLACGFGLEARMPGFGGDGREDFCQFACVPLPQPEET